jgi:hypothetical protein
LQLIYAEKTLVNRKTLPSSYRREPESFIFPDHNEEFET